MSACTDWQIDFWAALDGELPDKRGVTLAEHLSTCAECRLAAREAIAVHRHLLENAKPTLAGKAAPAFKAPRPESAEIPRQTAQATPARRIFVLDWKAWCAAAVMALGLTIFIYHQYGPGPAELARLATTAQIESCTGTVLITTEYLDNKEKAEPGQALSANEGIEIHGAGQAVIRYRDGTRVTLNSQTAARLFLRHVKGSQATRLRRGAGKRLSLEAGTLEADVVPQSSDNPMTIGTPQAEMSVVGTKFRVLLDGQTTRLDVSDGSVELVRRKDGASLVVAKDQYVVASWEGALVVKTVN